MPAVGHVQEALHDAAAHMGSHSFTQHGRTPGHQSRKDVFQPDETDGQQAGPEDEAARLCKQVGQGREYVQQLLHWCGCRKLLRCVEDGEKACQSHDAGQLCKGQQYHEDEEQPDGALQKGRQHSIDAFEIGKQQMQFRHGLPPAKAVCQGRAAWQPRLPCRPLPTVL